MAAKPKLKGPPAASTRERILAVAVEEFMEKGAQSVSLRSISRKAGLTPMAIYRHYENKQALVEGVIRQGFQEYADYLDIIPHEDPLEHLEALAGRVFDFASERGALFELIFLTSRSAIGLPDREILSEVHGPTYDIARNALAICRDHDRMQFDDLRHMTNNVLAWCIGFCAFYISGMLGPEKKRSKKQFQLGFRRMITPYLSQKNRSLT